LSLARPKGSFLDAIPGIEPGNACSGPRNSAQFGRIAHLASICRYVVSSLRPAALATVLIAVCFLIANPVYAAPLALQVNTLADVTDATSMCAVGASTTCSLRDAITLANANSGSTIQFTPGLAGTIYMNSAPGTAISITASMNILGPGDNQISIDFANVSNFVVSNGTVKTWGLNFINGLDDAILNDGGNLTIDHCVLTGTSGGGAALYNSGSTSTMTVTNSLIYGNSNAGTQSGAGIANYSGTLTVMNSTITGNTSIGAGGGIFNSGTATVLSSTIVGNTAVSTGSKAYIGGGGIYNYGTITITNSIVAANNPNGVADSDDCDGCGTQSPYNLIGGAPTIGVLAWNGGPIQTMLPEYASIVAGKGSYVSGTPATDQRGFPRPTSGAIDLGAVQSHYLTVNTNTDSDDGACTLTTCSFRDALEQANADGEGDIRFIPAGTGDIVLSSGKPLPAIAADLNIVGPGASKLKIDGNQSSAVGSVLTINNLGLVAISGITITNGSGSNATNPIGGAITSSGQLTVSNSVLSGNASANAGSIVNYGGWLHVDSSTISGNAAYGGGAIYNEGGSTVIVNSTLSGNTVVDSNGGGIWSYGGAVLLNNSTISGNSAVEGGGIYYSCPSSGVCGGVIVNNSTISANIAAPAYTAGGIYNATGTAVMLYNSIVAGNAAGGTPNSGDCPNCGSQSKYNFIGGNPQLSPLQLNGRGTTLETMIPLPGSPVMDAGNWTLSANGPTILNQALYTDERGFPRPAGASAIDLGAVQTNYSAVSFIRQPSDTTVGQNIMAPPAVEVDETNTANGLIDGVAGVPVTLTFSGGASEIVTQSALTTTTVSLGRASFTGLAVNTPGVGYTLTVASPVIGSTTVTSNTFNVLAYAATPTFSSAAGVYFSIPTVTISSTTPSASIYYTTDGSTPTTSSTLYSGPVAISLNGTVLQAIAVANGYANSAVASVTYTLRVATPTISPATSTYTSAQTVAMTDTTPGATIYYTTDGSTPTGASTKYSSPFTVSTTETVQAVAIFTGFANSAVAQADYTINIPSAATPTFSPAAGTYSGGQSVTISDTTPGAAIYYTTDGSTPTASSTQYASGIKVVNTEIINAIAIATGYTNSAVATAAYTINPVNSPNFTVAVTPATLAVTAGQSGTVTVSVTPQYSFASAVSFTCSGLPAGASCSFSPATVTPSGTAASPTTLTVTTSSSMAAAHSNSSPFLPEAALAAALCFFSFRKRRNMQLLLLLAVSAIGLGLFNGCGSGSSTTSRTHITSTVTVTGTSGTATTAIQNSTTFSLTVN
jgi:hypothetical protein